MNIMFCGDSGVIDGIMISVLSLAEHTDEALKVFVLTMDYEMLGKKYRGIRDSDLAGLLAEIRKKNARSEIRILDVGEVFKAEPVTANKRTYFTPYCMLRLFADKLAASGTGDKDSEGGDADNDGVDAKLKVLPDKILYLDTDIVCLNDPMSFYEIDNSKYEMVGVLDRYGGKIIRVPFTRQKYLNSGVLLLNLPLIRKTGLLERAREMCRKRVMIMPDQSALNFCAKYKKIVGRKYNEQEKIFRNTVFRHFSNTFKFFPYFKVQKVKPWDVEKLHKVLNTYEIDDVLEKWHKLKAERTK